MVARRCATLGGTCNWRSSPRATSPNAAWPSSACSNSTRRLNSAWPSGRLRPSGADQLQRLAGELAEVEQHERRRLAQLLHDDLQQLLVATKMQLAAVRHAGPKAVDGAEQLLAQAIDLSRSLSIELTPPVLYDLGLNAVLEWYARWVRDKYALNVELELDGSEPVESESLGVLVFEAVRELLLNVVKHAGTDQARVTLRRRAGELRVTVKDLGAGFDPEARRAETERSGYGLFSLQERLELVNGHVQIDSAGHGHACRNRSATGHFRTVSAERTIRGTRLRVGGPDGCRCPCIG